VLIVQIIYPLFKFLQDSRNKPIAVFLRNNGIEITVMAFLFAKRNVDIYTGHGCLIIASGLFAHNNPESGSFSDGGAFYIYFPLMIIVDNAPGK
jgi:hypothetical protein